MGADVPAASGDNVSDGFQIWRPNWPAVMGFLECETQWRCIATYGGLIWLGLDYTAVDVVLRRLGFPDHVFAEIQHMETAAIDVLREAG